MAARQVAGAIITVLGILLLIYGLAVGAAKGSIGTYAMVDFNKEKGELEVVQGKPGIIDREAASVILGWFLILIGPALWFGEVPATLKSKAGS